MENLEGTVLIVDDNKTNLFIMTKYLESYAQNIVEANNGQQALDIIRSQEIDTILLDINMPVLDGFEVLRILKSDPNLRDIPVIIVSAIDEIENSVKCIEMGAEEYLTKPFQKVLLNARVKSSLGKKIFRDREKQYQKEIKALNEQLKKKVEMQAQEIERMNQLRKFFSPQIVNYIVSGNSEEIFQDHLREITVVFLDLRNFTLFTEVSSELSIIKTIRELHHKIGPIVFKYGGTLERFTGDGVMIFFGDPQPIDDHPLQAVKMCIEILENIENLRIHWQNQGVDLPMGIGVATGVATIGLIGFEGRFDYAALGNVTNLAARLCGKAKGCQILISESTYQKIKDCFHFQDTGFFQLKGFSKDQRAYIVRKSS